ncbi:hypothetical protein BT63DRAFT_152785 [Microthyrium microscopicum]|uniref:Uncharacterized protein n=1 Tax=Microthyrium microscopicum TaxID=703497 RepID=A0A6A6UNL8_9PEZI|nr:hypothetical protein BT63DRAFT_152785 [Microthyrium microscopicum]
MLATRMMQRTALRNVARRPLSLRSYNAIRPKELGKHTPICITNNVDNLALNVESNFEVLKLRMDSIEYELSKLNARSRRCTQHPQTFPDELALKSSPILDRRLSFEMRCLEIRLRSEVNSLETRLGHSFDSLAVKVSQTASLAGRPLVVVDEFGWGICFLITV